MVYSRACGAGIIIHVIRKCRSHNWTARARSCGFRECDSTMRLCALARRQELRRQRVLGPGCATIIPAGGHISTASQRLSAVAHAGGLALDQPVVPRRGIRSRSAVPDHALGMLRPDNHERGLAS